MDNIEAAAAAKRQPFYIPRLPERRFCGKRGLNSNGTKTCAKEFRSAQLRIVHRASGAAGESPEHMDQPHNKKAAFMRD